MKIYENIDIRFNSFINPVLGGEADIYSEEYERRTIVKTLWDIKLKWKEKKSLFGSSEQKETPREAATDKGAPTISPKQNTQKAGASLTPLSTLEWFPGASDNPAFDPQVLHKIMGLRN